MLIRGWREAERVAAEWMKLMGYSDSHADARAGADGGVDVESSHAVAQVKHRSSRSGLPDVQRHFGVAVSHGKTPIFFSLSGYSKPALKFGADEGMALFSYTRAGALRPESPFADRLFAAAMQAIDARTGGPASMSTTAIALTSARERAGQAHRMGVIAAAVVAVIYAALFALVFALHSWTAYALALFVLAVLFFLISVPRRR